MNRPHTTAPQTSAATSAAASAPPPSTASAEAGAAAKRKAADEARAAQARVQAKIDALALTMLDKLGQIAASVAVPPPLPAATMLAKRRLIANLLASHRTCGRPSCRRRHACVGEPVECLSSRLVYVDPEMLAMLTAPRRRPRRR